MKTKKGAPRRKKKKFTWVLKCDVELEIRATSMEEAIEKALDKFEAMSSANGGCTYAMVDDAAPVREFKAV